MAHLLIAEDDELLRDGLRTIFTQAGHEVSTCVDGGRRAGLGRHPNRGV